MPIRNFVSDLQWPPPPPRLPPKAETLFEFIRASDRAPMSCELKFHGESYGWEAIFLVRGELFASHGGFMTRGAAVGWAERQRLAFCQTNSVM